MSPLDKDGVLVIDDQLPAHYVRMTIVLLKGPSPLARRRRKVALQQAQIEVEFIGREAAEDTFQQLAYVMAGWEREIQSKGTKSEVYYDQSPKGDDEAPEADGGDAGGGDDPGGDGSDVQPAPQMEQGPTSQGDGDMGSGLPAVSDGEGEVECIRHVNCGGGQHDPSCPCSQVP